ncbi:MAG: porin [Proteobacteria bacterium]|nr:porin [Pseudomonadota bacterium]MCL2307749.1 porin [Pseudomonadota bacterium]
MRHRFHIASIVLTVGLLSAFAAQAQNNVALFGVIDTGIEYVNHASQGSGSVIRIPTLSGSVPSRLGFRGAESLGNGLDAVFVLENGFAPDQGGNLQGGRLFGRQSTLGLRGAWGHIDIGRQWTTTFRAIIDADVIGPAVFSLASLDSYLPNARVDNSVSYYGTFGGLTIGGVYSLGRDASPAGNCGGEQGNRACTSWSALVKYNAAQWGVTGAFEEIRGGSSATPIIVVPGAAGIAFNHSGDKDQRYHLNGYVKINQTKIGGGWLYRNIATDARNLHTNLYYLGASVPVQNMTFDGQISYMDNPSYDSKATLFVLRATYAFSKRTAAYLSTGYIHNRGNGPAYSVSASSMTVHAPNPGQSQIGAIIGLRHAF